MKVLVTGGTGFVGGWLVEELRNAGHAAVPTPPTSTLDITDAEGVARFIGDVRPDAVVHLAGVAYAGDANRDPSMALMVNEGGTRAVLTAVADHGSPPVVVAGSSEVYGHPRSEDLPLRESAPLKAEAPYARSKLAQERAAVELAASRRLSVAVLRSFNMIGPRQRAEFAAPALARRVLEARRTGSREIMVGNADSRRDFCDVRDAARAYRLVLEALSAGRLPSGAVLNVATGRATSIRRLVEILCDIIGVSVHLRVDPALVRGGDPQEIIGDASRLHELTGWRPTIPLERSLADLVASIDM